MVRVSCAILATLALVAGLEGAAQRSGAWSSHIEPPTFNGLPLMDASPNPDQLRPFRPIPFDLTWKAVASGRNSICIFNLQTLQWEPASPVTAYAGGLDTGISLAGSGMEGSETTVFAAPSRASTYPLIAFNLLGQRLLPLGEIGTFPGSHESGYRFTVGDLFGDLTPELIVGNGPGGGPHVRVYSTGTNEVMTVLPFGPDYRDGFNFATGDINGNGTRDLLIAQARGREFTALEFTDLTHEPRVLGFGDPFGPSYFGGSNVAALDFNGDGFSEVVFGAADGPPLLRIVNFNGPTTSLVYQLTAGPSTATEGVRVDVGLRNGSPVISTLTDLASGPTSTRQELVIWLLQGQSFEPSFTDVPYSGSEAFFKFIEEIRARR